MSAVRLNFTKQNKHVFTNRALKTDFLHFFTNSLNNPFQKFTMISKKIVIEIISIQKTGLKNKKSGCGI